MIPKQTTGKLPNGYTFEHDYFSDPQEVNYVVVDNFHTIKDITLRYGRVLTTFGSSTVAVFRVKMKNIIAALCLFILFTSCSKDESHETFVPLTVEQEGELLILWGYLPAPITDPWRYVVEVDYGTCAPKQEYTITIPKGSTSALTNDQHSCPIVSWKILYADILKQ